MTHDESISSSLFQLKLIYGIMSWVFRLLSLIGIAAVILTLLLFDFMSRSEPHERSSDIPRTAIVFTGDFDRIYKGIELLSAGSADRLFITGVNGDAGLNVARFASQFELNSDQADWVATRKIVLAPDAHSTIENALETACWLDTQTDIKAVTLITSRRHMARASVALQHGIFPISVVRVVSDSSDEYDKFQLDLLEFTKFVATWFITLFPLNLWPGTEPAFCWGR